MRSNSCAGCKFVYKDGSGYSNWTWMETHLRCALGKAEFGDAEVPYDWNENPEGDNWGVTRESRCREYKPCGPALTLDPDRECWPRIYGGYKPPEDRLAFVDEEQFKAIWDSDSFWGHSEPSLLTLAIYNGLEPYPVTPIREPNE